VRRYAAPSHVKLGFQDIDGSHPPCGVHLNFGSPSNFIMARIFEMGFNAVMAQSGLSYLGSHMYPTGFNHGSHLSMVARITGLGFSCGLARIFFLGFKF